MSEIPKTVRVGPCRYEVVSDRKALHSVDSNCNGVTSIEHQRITVDPDRGADSVARTVLHEVLHGIWHNAGGRDEGLNEEHAIRTFAGGLLGVLRDNPDLVAYLTER